MHRVMMEIVYTGIPACILSLIAAFVIVIKSFKGMLEEWQKRDKRLCQVTNEMNALKKDMPEKQKRVTKLQLSPATMKDRSIPSRGPAILVLDAETSRLLP